MTPTGYEEMDPEDIAGEVDGSDVERVIDQMVAYGPPGAMLAELLWRALLIEYAKIDPESVEH